MGSPRFYLHVGLAKSGTTYLQDVLFASADELRAQGAAMVPVHRVGHFRMALHVVGDVQPADEAVVTRARGRFARQLQDESIEVGVLSHEILAPAPVAAIEQLVAELGDREVHVVLTVRDLGRTLASSWQQNLKQRHTSTYEEFLADVVGGGPAAYFFNAGQRLPEVVGRWSQVVPLERVHVVVVPPGGSDRKLLLERFCEALGLDATPLGDAPKREGNPALGQPQAELLRRVNVALGDRLPHPREGYREQGKRWLAEQVLRSRTEGRPRLPQHLRPWVEQETEAWIHLARTSGVQVHGDPGQLRTPPWVFADAAELAVSDDELLATAVDALADILQLRHEERLEAEAGPGAPTDGGSDAGSDGGAGVPQRRTTRRWRLGRG